MTVTSTRVRLCLKDLYQQDIVEMIERETRRYELLSIEHPDHRLGDLVNRLVELRLGRVLGPHVRHQAVDVAADVVIHDRIPPEDQ